MNEKDSGSATDIIAADHPIRRLEDDVLGRAQVAQALVRQIFSLDASEGFVVGILGPWGSGKTSLLNLARLHLDEASIPVLEFNPWMFSGTEQLVEAFFTELSAQLRLRKELGDIGKRLEEYGEVLAGMAWLPLAGPWIERVRGTGKTLARTLQRRRQGVGGLRGKVAGALAVLDAPIVVVLDDIDRLTSQEIRDVFKLVRLTANFPNLVYVVAFDRMRVEKALSEGGMPGRDYLEKILQVGRDLPAVPEQLLRRQIFVAIDRSLAGLSYPGPFDEAVWPDVFMEVIRPLIRNMRDVHRYSASIHGAARELDGQVALVDLLAVEAVRVFLPDVFDQMCTSILGLTTTSEITGLGREDPPELKAQVEGLIRVAGERSDVVRALISRIFPAAQQHIGSSHYGPEWKRQWLRERRIAHEDILRLYLERVAGERLKAFTDAERAWSVMADRAVFEAFLRSLEAERLEDVISSLEAYEDEFMPRHVVPATTVLLNLLPDLPERRRGLFDIDGRTVFARVVLRLLRALDGPHNVESAVREILPDLESLSAKQELVDIVGHKEGRGHKLAPEAAATEFARALRDEVRSASVDGLIGEGRDLLRILFTTMKESAPSESRVEIGDSPEMTVALLRSAHGEARSQTLGSRVVKRSPRLAWDVLIELYGDEETLEERIQVASENPTPEDRELLELADKYLKGWRPDLPSS